MSKDNNLRLLGSPVNLTYRNKKKDDKKNIKNRPRSALQDSAFVPDFQEKFKRPFSADAKERAQSTRNFYNSFNAELQQTYNNSLTNMKVVARKNDLLRNSEGFLHHNVNIDKELCSNASDYGSEDTFISLGTKIKNKAQVTPKCKNSNTKNFLKYRNLRKTRKYLDNFIDEKSPDACRFGIKVTEKSPNSHHISRDDQNHMRSLSPSYKNRAYESYFIPLNSNDIDSLAGRVSFGSTNVGSKVTDATDLYSRRINETKHQLSLVEEESTQDLDSAPSRNISDVSPSDSLEIAKNRSNDIVSAVDYLEIDPESYLSTNKPWGDEKTYGHFYDDITMQDKYGYKRRMSSTVITDASSKDSGYAEFVPSEDKVLTRDYSLPTATSIKKSSSLDEIDRQSKSLNSISAANDRKGNHKTFPFDRKINKPLNHSRLLYKDFFLKKEGHIALPPQNSPHKSDDFNVLDNNGAGENKKEDILEYPTYLLNSSTKAYTSKVIEDYKKELEAINNLHELTLKDIKCDNISPTPLDIDVLFEQHNTNEIKNKVVNDNSSESVESQDLVGLKSDSVMNNRRDISKISTKELIQNYLKIKGNCGKEFVNKSIIRHNKKNRVTTNEVEEGGQTEKKYWNNKSKSGIKNNLDMNARNETPKNLFPMKTPLSARIESVQNDRDIESWMSMTPATPVNAEVDNVEEKTVNHDFNICSENDIKKDLLDRNEINIKQDQSDKSDIDDHCQLTKPKELNTNSTVFDIYTMLKDIESYGEKSVTEIANTDTISDDKAPLDEEKSSTPKDNFMEIFEFLEKVEQSANEALSVVTSATPPTIPKLETLLKLPQTELAQRLVTASLQLEERSCCIALLQESLANHKEQMVNKVSNLEKQSLRNISKVKQECEEAIKRHQAFIDQLINDKKTLNHRIEQLVDERRSVEERWKRSAQSMEERYKLELRNQHDKMAAAQQVARQRWVRQKAEKIKELTVKGLEGELREMAERQQKEIADLKMSHAEYVGRLQAKHAQELEELRRSLEDEKENALVKERQLASSRLEKQILELEATYQEQRTRLVAEMRAENERAANELSRKEWEKRRDIEKWREEQEQAIEEKRSQMQQEIAKQKEYIDEMLKVKQHELEQKFEQYKKDFEAEQQVAFKKKVTEIATQHKQERDREIEKAIDNMEAEAQAGRKELQEALRRNKDQYEAELKELAETEQATLRRYQEAQARVRQAEDRCAEFEVNLSQLEAKNKVLTEKSSQMESQMEMIRKSCEEEWRGKMEELNKQIEEAQKTHEEQMHQLYAKVKVAVARKDSAIQALTRENSKYKEKIALLEQKLQQQRKDFLKHK